MPSDKPSPFRKGLKPGGRSPEAQGELVSAVRRECWPSPASASGSLDRLPPEPRHTRLNLRTGTGKYRFDTCHLSSNQRLSYSNHNVGRFFARNQSGLGKGQSCLDSLTHFQYRSSYCLTFISSLLLYLGWLGCNVT